MTATLVRLDCGRPIAQLMPDSFYESDCQGETSSPLIAGRSPPEQSAPSAERTRPWGAAGVAAQSSSSASVSSLLLPINAGRSQGLGSRDARGPWFYLRLGPGAGLTLLRVLRGGLKLGEYLGATAGRANESLETAP